MTEHTPQTAPSTRWLVPMRARSPLEAHRAATPLELLFDLVFVVAIARAASELHHGIAENHAPEAILGFVIIFMGIWWAWMNFTWFASSYDTDDVPYRLLVMTQMTGALILAAGVGGDFSTVVVGYVIMRMAQVAQWIRAARSDPDRTTTSYRYAFGIAALQVLWIARLWVAEEWQVPTFFMLILLELIVPIWAELARQTTPHPDHIVERYGLLTIIVLGESILSATVALQSVIDTDDWNVSLVGIIVGGLLVIYSMWWLYFDQSVEHLMDGIRTVFTWGYGHYVIFAAAAAVGAGLAVSVDYATDQAEISTFTAGASVAFPVALYVMGVWFLHQRPRATNAWQLLRAPLFAVLIALTPFTGQAVLLSGLLMALLVGTRLLDSYRAHVSSQTLATS